MKLSEQVCNVYSCRCQHWSSFPSFTIWWCLGRECQCMDNVVLLSPDLPPEWSATDSTCIVDETWTVPEYKLKTVQFCSAYETWSGALVTVSAVSVAHYKWSYLLTYLLSEITFYWIMFITFANSNSTTTFRYETSNIHVGLRTIKPYNNTKELREIGRDFGNPLTALQWWEFTVLRL